MIISDIPYTFYEYNPASGWLWKQKNMHLDPGVTFDTLLWPLSHAWRDFLQPEEAEAVLGSHRMENDPFQLKMNHSKNLKRYFLLKMVMFHFFSVYWTVLPNGSHRLFLKQSNSESGPFVQIGLCNQSTSSNRMTTKNCQRDFAVQIKPLSCRVCFSS